MFALTSSFQTLEKALVHTPGQEIERLVPWYIDHPLTFDVEYTRHLPTLQKEHQSLVAVLKREIGADNVLQVIELLEEVFEHVEKRQDILVEMLGRVRFKKYSEALEFFAGENTTSRSAANLAHDMITGFPREWMTTAKGEVILPTILPKDGMRHVRDPAAILPSGVILGAMKRLRRTDDAAVLRAIFKYSKRLASEIILDLDWNLKELAQTNNLSSPLGLGLEGGNTLVLSQECIVIGVTYTWSNSDFDAQRYRFQELIRRLFMSDRERVLQKIYVVNIPNIQHFWHLDSVFNMIGPRSAIAMPYIFGRPQPISDSLHPFVSKIAADLAMSGDYPRYPYNLPSEQDLLYSGMTEVYLREDYEKHNRATPCKKQARRFLDQLEEDGYLAPSDIVWAGGDPGNHPNVIEHLRVALREQASQACNVLVVRPFWLIAVDQNPYTLKSLQRFLEKRGGYLEIVPGVEHVKAEGGPHCLVLDLQRRGLLD